MLQYKMKPNMTDRILSIIRGSSKNKETPVIIYMPEKPSDLSEKDIRKILSLKERCRTLEFCDLMEKGYSSAQFRALAKKHLEHF